MKYCNKCGKPLEASEKFCSGCGNKLEEVKGLTEVKEAKKDNKAPLSEEDNKKANTLGIVSLALYFGSYLLSFFLVFINTTVNIMSSTVGPFISIFLGFIPVACRLAGLITMIVMRVKYPQSTFGKILMWIYIGLYALGFVLIILVLVLFFILMYSLASTY